MKKIIRFLILILVLPVLLQAQYTGGIGNGDASINLTNAHIIIHKIETELPTKYGLFQNYPNPFNPNTKIRFQIKEQGFVSLKVYDILGKEVATLVYEKQLPGTFELSWDATGNPNGIYFYRIDTDNFSDTKKMVLTK